MDKSLNKRVKIIENVISKLVEVTDKQISLHEDTNKDILNIFKSIVFIMQNLKEVSIILFIVLIPSLLFYSRQFSRLIRYILDNIQQITQWSDRYNSVISVIANLIFIITSLVALYIFLRKLLGKKNQEK